MSACRVICPPQVPLTAVSLIAAGEGWPLLPRGWNSVNRACLSATVCVGSSGSERISTDAAAPWPMVCTAAGSWPTAFSYTPRTSSTVAGAPAPAAGNCS